VFPSHLLVSAVTLHSHVVVRPSLAVGILAAMGGIGFFMSLAEAKMKEEKERKRITPNTRQPPFVPMHR
jgi:hypothetical protein